MPKKLDIEQARAAAKDKNGACLSNVYINNHEDMKWECEISHTFEKPLKRVLKGEWCPFCSGKYVHLKLSELRDVAEKRGGKFLGENDLIISAVGNWQCGDGHRWSAIVNNVVNLGSWCKSCKNNQGEQITRFIFQKLTGKLFPSKRPIWLRFEGTNRSLELDGFNEELSIAFEHQGKQHYQSSQRKSRYYSDSVILNDIEKLRICNDKGIKVLEVPQIGEIIKLDIAVNMIKEFLVDNKIPIVSDIYDEELIDNISGLKKNHINSLRKIAKSKGGECLSEVYLGHVYPLNFICSKGHQWEARPNDIKRGSWCSICSKAGGKKKNLDDLKNMFKDSGIQCISKKYVNSKEKYLWQCSFGHQFYSRYDTLKKGRLCPLCN
jgi:hypothetical protein